MITKLNDNVTYTVCPDCGMTVEVTQVSTYESFSCIKYKPPSKEEQTALGLAGRLEISKCWECHVRELDEERHKRAVWLAGDIS